MHADPDLARAEAAEKARERGVFVGRSDEHGTKTMYIKAAAGAVIRNEATLDRDRRGVEDLRRHPPRPAPPRRRGRHHRRPPLHPRTPHPSPPPPPHHPTPPGHRATTPDTTLTRRHHAAPRPDTAPTPLRTPRQRPGTTAPPRASACAGTAGCPEAGDDARAHADHRPGPGSCRPPGRLGPRRRSRVGDRDAAAPRLGRGWGPVGVTRTGPSIQRRARPGRRGRPRRTPPEQQRPARPPRHPRHRADRTLRPLRPRPTHRPRRRRGEPLDAAAHRALHARLAQIKHDAYTTQPPTGADRAGSPDRSGGGRLRPGQTQIYVHLTDHTLATGTGVLRAEGIGPLLADQLAELIGYGPYTVKPVIDLNDAVSVDAYEIPDRIRERVKLTHPVELFPFGTQETHRGMDLDHIQPYDPLGPPGQTSTTNLAPLGRFGHRVKTHAHGWNVRRLDPKTLEWTTPHGFTFHVDPTGTHRVHAHPDSRASC